MKKTEAQPNIYTYIKVEKCPHETRRFLMRLARIFWYAQWHKCLVCAMAENFGMRYFSNGLQLSFFSV